MENFWIAIRDLFLFVWALFDALFAVVHPFMQKAGFFLSLVFLVSAGVYGVICIAKKLSEKDLK
jgi:p-aminobenzoyl-glutamate transporter AbgT